MGPKCSLQQQTEMGWSGRSHKANSILVMLKQTFVHWNRPE